MSDDAQVSAYSEPPREENPYAEGWREGVIAMETWALEQGLDRRSVHSVAVQIMHSAVPKEERRATKYGEYQPTPVEPIAPDQVSDEFDEVLDDFTGPEWQDQPLPDGIELKIVEPETADDGSDEDDVDVMARVQEDMTSAEARDEELPPFESELASLLNRYSAESVSGTPDFILAKFMLNTLKEFNEAVSHRSWWRGEFVDFDPSRDTKYFDHFTGEEIEHPSGERSEYYKKTGQFPNYSQWKASQE